MDLTEALMEIAREARESWERRVVVLRGYTPSELAPFLRVLSSERRIRVLYAGTKKDDRLEHEEALSMENVDLKSIDMDDSTKILGRTYDLLIMDVSEQFRPNDLGVLVETVGGGGLILITLPEDWTERLTLFQRNLISPPYTSKDVRQAFKRRFLSSLGVPGIWLITRDSIVGTRRIEKHELPSRMESDDPVESLVMSEDQLQVLRTVRAAASSRSRQAVVITANRGRGKSAALGLAISQLIGRRLVKTVGVTSASVEGVQVLFDFIKRGLEAQGIRYNEVRRDENTVSIMARGRIVFYRSPLSMSELKIRTKVVDEAATIPVHLLMRIVRRSRLSLFATTVHGYEGSGRGFTMKFLSYLERARDIDFRRLEMTTPIRYPENDPVERWLYDLLLLDAEPADIDEVGELEYVRIDPESADEEMLREFYGIYVLAHYRNRPNDLATMLEAPHHRMRALLTGGKVVASAQICEEGRLTRSLVENIVRREGSPPGHMIPSRIAVHYGYKSFSKLWGWRIVRIAVHPRFQGRGIGSKMLEFISQEAEEKGVDWVGASFGASPELINFWMKNEFIPVHLSPQRNSSSGEYSLFMLKPLSERAREIIHELNSELKNRILESAHDVYFDMDPEILRQLLSFPKINAELKLRQSQRIRLEDYLRDLNTYEMASDAIRRLLITYLLTSDGVDPRLVRILLAKNLQGKPWSSVMRLARVKNLNDALAVIKDCVRQIYSTLSGGGTR